MSERLFYADSPVQPEAGSGTGEMVTRNGESWHCIRGYDALAPFFMSVVSGGNHWMFVSSSGGLTCGRGDPDNALFPYLTDDKIHDAWSNTGPVTMMRVRSDGRDRLWQPFDRGVPVYRIERNLYKNRIGNKLEFEEVNHDLGLAFRYLWTTCERFGFVRRCRLENRAADPVEVELIDGLRNILPHGVARNLQATMSTLVDAYKQSEVGPGSTAGIYALSSIPTDRAEPSESLRANVAWAVGLHDPKVLLSETQLDRFRRGKPVRAQQRLRGQRGAFLLHDRFALPATEARQWHVVADVGLGPSAVQGLLDGLRSCIDENRIEEDVSAGSERLKQLVGKADGFQRSGDERIAARHFSNSLFNIMRGGVFQQGYCFPVDDFLDFVDAWHRPLADRFRQELKGRQAPLTLTEAQRIARAMGDPDAERLVLEYLPLTFSRRHGDPSRPWNTFSIRLQNPDGTDHLTYEGNWRDIFQNWEALAWSYPGFVENFIAKFVNASTLDGYNPFRVMRQGFEWEVLEPDDPWSNIGYWGDHQVGYLQRLLDISQRYHPDVLPGLLDREIFVYANVPYRLKPYAEQLRDPRSTVAYDRPLADEIRRRVERLGADGRLVPGPEGDILRVSLLEKLLVPALVKLGNLAPGGGIWMNTQRPEWNDANNALAGHGLSMVTLCYLRAYLGTFQALLDSSNDGEFAVTRELGDYFTGMSDLLAAEEPDAGSPSGPADRKRFMDAAGALGESWRTRIYGGLCGRRSRLRRVALVEFCERARRHIDYSIAVNRRDDGLFNSYNLISFRSEGYEVQSLPEMLEGQVAVLNSGYLDGAASAALLDALRASRLYRPDQDSYLLYPDRTLPGFLEKNIIPEEQTLANEFVRRELARGGSDYVEQDVLGLVHFNGRFRNAGELREVLRQDPEITEEQVESACALFESVFRHHRFTGRSGTMYKYEGLGCVYWHMVSKLALAVAETVHSLAPGAARREQRDLLVAHFHRIEAGLGTYKSPREYGAFPVDAYSHTPAFNGAQQPGLTGQVKEDIIARFLELGLRVEQGELMFSPHMMCLDEFLRKAEDWRPEANGSRSLRLEEGMVGFTYCGVPICYRLAESASVEVHASDGEVHVRRDLGLGRRWSEALFTRAGTIEMIIVNVPATALASGSRQ